MQKITRQLLLIESIGDLPKIELDIKHLLQAKNLTILEAIDFTKATTKASKIGYKAPGQ